MNAYSSTARYTRHGGSYDRGSADSYYGRPAKPHYFEGDTYGSVLVEVVDPTNDEYMAYMQGYCDNNEAGNFKDWG